MQWFSFFRWHFVTLFPCFVTIQCLLHYSHVLLHFLHVLLHNSDSTDAREKCFQANLSRMLFWDTRPGCLQFSQRRKINLVFSIWFYSRCWLCAIFILFCFIWFFLDFTDERKTPSYLLNENRHGNCLSFHEFSGFSVLWGREKKEKKKRIVFFFGLNHGFSDDFSNGTQAFSNFWCILGPNTAVFVMLWFYIAPFP